MIKAPFTDIQISKSDSGFYAGNNLPVVMVSKIVIVSLVLWALIYPGNANSILSSINWKLLEEFNTFYIIIVGLFSCFLFIIALLPQSGSRIMGNPNDKPEFSNFSWFSMMFGAGLGVGLMVYATAEPISLWGSNPEIISGLVKPHSEIAINSAYRYTFLHYGLHAWMIYVVPGISLAYLAYTRNMPLTIRSALTPLFGAAINGFIGHLVDILGIVATMLGISVTIGFGVLQFIDGLYAITGIEWIMDFDGAIPTPSTIGLLFGLISIMGLSIISAASGVGRGIKYLSNINLILSIVLIIIFSIFGSFLFAMTTYYLALIDYIINFTSLSFVAYSPQTVSDFTAALPLEAKPYASILIDGATNAWGNFEEFKSGLTSEALALSETTLIETYRAGEQGRQFSWQAGWTSFYWAWWIAFSPFVGLFLARISKGRTVREFIIGCCIVPSLVCFVWMTILGGTAIDLELNGIANGVIIDASNTAKLFVTLEQILSGTFFKIIIIMCIILIMTFLITSADSGILVMNNIMSGGEQETSVKHRIVWGIILTLLIGALLVAGKNNTGFHPMEAVKNAMIIGSLPFTIVMGLMCIALSKALYRDYLRSQKM